MCSKIMRDPNWCARVVSRMVSRTGDPKSIDLTRKRVANKSSETTKKKKAPSKRNTRSENPKPDKRKQRKTSPTTAAVPDLVTSDLAVSGAAAPGPAPVTPVNLYEKYADFPWGSKEFDPDTEFSGAFEQAKDWKCQKVNRALKAGVAESEHATVTGAPIGTKRNELSDVQRSKFKRLVQKTWKVMLVQKKAYILHRWYGLSQAQQRFYLELGEGDNIPVYTIPEGDLEETVTKPVNQFSVIVSVEPISCQAYARFEAPVDQPHAQDDAIAIANCIIQEMEIAEGGAEDCLSNALEDIEPVLEDDLSSSDTEAELTDSNDDGKVHMVKDSVIETPLWPASRLRQKGLPRPGGDRSPGLIPSDPDDDDYEDEAEIQGQEQMDKGEEGDEEDEESQGYEENEESQGKDEVEEEELDE
ncbi:hypothetical protein L211DRAFT_854623 [Terfezia boudieri ATCC MYA-4762]|uniref:Uncharacterized protein n=1 Tax=Terfezia boudieri ATCC MYA-4762 TaxID=1051890 RepID=A0A3N4L912_9PEZI|nr:hypothetical protein L211DRAFT_854623 [Terfezia boudieri ATCC MYA-4762]